MDSFISWIGGKKLLRKAITERFPKETEYDRYIEVFGGAGWVLFSLGAVFKRFARKNRSV